MSAPIQFNPEKAREAVAQATYLYNSEKLNEALAELEKVMTQYEPRNIEAHILAAKIFLSARKDEKVLNVINHLHQFNQPTVESLALKAKAEFLKDDTADCESTLKDIYAIDRSYKGAVEIEGDVLLKKKDFKKAVILFNSLMKRYPGETVYPFKLAVAHYHLQEYEDTISLCAELKDLNIRNGNIDRLYKNAVRHKRKIEMAKNPNLNFFQKIFWGLFDPYAERTLRIQSKSEREAKYHQSESLTDELTKIYNRKAFNQVLPNLIAKAKPGRLYVGFTDADFFKDFNDCFSSHDVGDEVLKALAAAANTFFPDKFFRYGGEEFCWIFEGEKDSAIKKASEFRKFVEEKLAGVVNRELSEKQIRDKDTKLVHYINFPVSISQGIASFDEDGKDMEKLINAADTNVYQAKQGGRNCISIGLSVVDRGKKPVKYNKAIIRILNDEAVKKGHKDWWVYSTTLDERRRNETYELAKNLAKDAPKEAAK